MGKVLPEESVLELPSPHTKYTEQNCHDCLYYTKELAVILVEFGRPGYFIHSTCEYAL